MRYETVEPGYRAFVARTLGDEGRAWLARLPQVLAELASQWRLELGPELPGGLLSCVREATLHDGTEVVLKVGAGPRTRDEITALRTWDARGAPALLAADEQAQALMLERVRPGSRPAGADAGAVAELLRQLHVEPPPQLPSLAEIVHARIDAALRDGRTSDRKAAWARAKVDELGRDAPPPALLHGDFDERNILACGLRGLCAIDPLPCAGDPAYDAGYWVHGERLPGRRSRLDAIVAATGLERSRVRDWAAVVGVHG